MTSALLVEVWLHDGRFHGVGDGGVPEWPPSPFRLFQALVAGAFGGRWADEDPEPKVAAFSWLEQLEPPTVVAPPARRLAPVLMYVPNNDLDAVGGDPRNLADIRTAKERVGMGFDPRRPVLYRWRFEGTDTSASAIAALADRLHTIGHGIDAAWARGRVLDEASADGLIRDHGGIPAKPAGAAAGGVPVPAPASVTSLLRRHQTTLERFRPEGARLGFAQPPKSHFRTVGYDRSPARLVFDLRPADGSPGFHAVSPRRALGLTTAVRDRLHVRLGGPAADNVIFGRGNPSPDVRIRIVATPSVGHEHTGPGIRRVLVEVPPECPFAVADVAWALVGQLLPDALGGALLTPSDDDDFLARHYGLGDEGHTRWESVTPVVLPPTLEPVRTGTERRTRLGAQEQAVRNALRHAGVDPVDAVVEVQPEPFHPRGLRAAEFEVDARFARRDRVHVRVRLAAAVRGPLVIGDGRWLGLGLMRPARFERTTSFALLRLNGDAPHAVRDTFQEGRRLHVALASVIGQGDVDDVALQLLGRDRETVSQGHTHAHLLPVDLDSDGQLNHAVVWRAAGLDDGALTVLRRLRRLWTRGATDDVEVRLVAAGTTEESPPELEAVMGRSARWVSATPFLAPRYTKARGKDAVERQVSTLCVSAGLPVPTVELLDATAFEGWGVWDPRHRPPAAVRHRVRLTFDRVVAGPIALGFGAHVGLGRFAPEG